MSGLDVERNQAERIKQTLKTIAGRYGETENGKLTVNGAQIDRDQLATAMEITRDQANVLKRALMRRGLLTQRRQNPGPSLLTFHYPPLPKEQRQSAARAAGQARRTDGVDSAVIAERQAIADRCSVQRHNVAIWCLVREPTSVRVEGKYTAAELRKLAESVGEDDARILIKGGTYSPEQLRGLAAQITRMLNKDPGIRSTLAALL